MPERWLDSGVAALRAEVCQVQTTREETVLLFGRQLPKGRAQLERRIILTPALAKQLAGGLAAIVREHEAQLNATPAGAITSQARDADVPAGARPVLAAVRGLGAGFGFEKSVKLAAGKLHTDRVIFGVRAAAAPRAGLLAGCRALGMPEGPLGELEAQLGEANTVGFGYEGGTYKVYLEFWDRLRARLRREPSNLAPALLFLGWKWPVRDPGRCALARYTCHPLLTIEGIARRLDALYEGGDGASQQAAQEILRLAAGRLRNDSFVYVEAEEQGNPRKSFDLNFYKARLTVEELRPALAPLARRYAIGAAELKKALGPALERPFGHLSGGLGRDGGDFLTVYYEIEGI